MTIDLSERKSSIKRYLRGKLNLDEMNFVLGDTDGTLQDPNFPGRYWVQMYAAGGLLGHRSVYGPTRSMPLQSGMPIRLKYDRKGRLQIDEIDQDSQLVTGVSPATLIAAQDSPASQQTDVQTLAVIPSSPASLSVAIRAWNPIISNVAYQFGGATVTLTVPVTSGHMYYGVIFVKSDFAATEVKYSTSRLTSDLDLGPADIQECLSAKSAGSTPVYAIKLINGQTAITLADLKNDGVPLQQLVNTAEAVQATTSASGTVANTTSETTVLGTVAGSTTLAANSLAVGRTIRIQAWGIVSDTGTPTLTIKIKMGSTVILTTGAITLASGITNKLWRLEAIITCRSVGGSGTVFGQGQFQYNNGLFTDIVNTATTTVDTTASQAIDVTATWSAASASNTVSSTNCIIEVL